MDAFVTRPAPVVDPASLTEQATTRPAAVPHPGQHFTKKKADLLPIPTPLFNQAIPFAPMMECIMNGLSDAMFYYASKGSIVAKWNESARGDIIEDVMRRYCVIDEPDNYHVVEPDPGVDVNGNPRPMNSATYDFGIVRKEDGYLLTTEVKSAIQGFDKGQNRWKVVWHNVKPEQAENQLLCLVLPDRIVIHVWQDPERRRPFLSKQGKKTRDQGSNVVVTGPSNELDPAKAVAAIREKLNASTCVYMDEIMFDEERFADVLLRTTSGNVLYVDAPLGSVSTTTRGTAMERVCRLVLGTQFHLTVTDAPTGPTTANANQQRGKNTTTCDLLVNGKPTEVKSSLMGWVKYSRLWRITFTSVKPELHELLYLCFVTPHGVHLLLHDGVAGLSKNGKAQASDGMNITFTGVSGQEDWQDAERHLLKTMCGWHKFTYLAFVAFAEDDGAKALHYGATQCAWDDDDDDDEL